MPEPRAKSENRQRTELVGVRLTPDEKRQLDAIAEGLGVSRGELIRRRCLHA